MTSISVTVNGVAHQLAVDEDRRLLWVLRDDLGLTGTKFGCGVSACGACTVMVDGKAVHSCTATIKSVDGKHVTTIEGLAKGDQLVARAAGLRRPSRLPVRLLHARHDHGRDRAARDQPQADA